MTTTYNDWQINASYHRSDIVLYGSIIYICIKNISNSDIPPIDDTEHWQAADIYKKNATVMEHGNYSGDDSFWARDQIYIDSAGYVYVNNENTGINVNGKTTVDVEWESLTEEQREQLRGAKGEPGPQGIQGEPGPMGAVQWDSNITPEQIEQLRGPQGKSAYDIWIDAGHQGTEEDFLIWIYASIMDLDTELSTTSVKGVQNKVITAAINNLQTSLLNQIRVLETRIADLENRLKYSIDEQEDILFKFGVTSEGNYGYFISGTNTIIPFRTEQNTLTSISSFEDNGIFGASMSIDSPLTSETVADLDSLSSPASLQGTMAPYSSNINTNTIQSNSVTEYNNLEDFFNMYNYVYQNGQFIDNTITYFLHEITYNYNDGSTSTSTLISNKNKDYCSIWFNPGELKNKGNTVYIDIEPLTSGQTVSYKMNSFNEYQDNIDFIQSDQNAVTGSFNQATTLKFEDTHQVAPNQGFYFSSTNNHRFKITAIYMK